MANLRKYSLLACAIILLIGAFGTFSAFNGWWVLSLAALFIALLATIALVLLCVRHLLRQILTLQRHLSQNRRRDAKWQTEITHDISRDTKSVKNELKRVTDSQEETLVLLESKINNLDTRLQKLLDKWRFGERKG